MTSQDRLEVSNVNSKGYGIISKMAMQDQRLHINAKAIYAYFNSFAGAGNSAFPTRNKICFDLGISGDTFGKYLKQLIDTGYIKVTQNKENGRFSNNVYTICDTVSVGTENTDAENAGSEITDTENIGTGELVTNNNNTLNNNSLKNNNNKNNSLKKKSVQSRFVPPSVEEVSAYCIERKNGIDAEQFIDFYASKGWKIGKEAMKDWKACVRTWERRRSNGSGKEYGKNGVAIKKNNVDDLEGVF